MKSTPSDEAFPSPGSANREAPYPPLKPPLTEPVSLEILPDLMGETPNPSQRYTAASIKGLIVTSSLTPGLDLMHAATFSDEHYYTVSGELGKNLAFVQQYKSLQELEIELFDLCRDYEAQFALRGVSLKCVRDMYHIAQLQDHAEDLLRGESREICRELETSLTAKPWTMGDYKWVERAFRFLNLLAMKWEVIDPNLYRYRNSLRPPVDPLQLHKYKIRQIWVFPLETLWFACSCTEPPLKKQIPTQLVALGKTLQSRTLELIRTIAGLNFRVNFKLNPNIKDYLGTKSEEEVLFHMRKRQIKPESHVPTISAMGESIGRSGDLQDVAQAIGQQALERGLRHKKAKINPNKHELKRRRQKAREIGFHLLELPAVLCKCMEQEEHTTNVRLKAQITNYELVFRVFECQFLRLLEGYGSVQWTREHSFTLKAEMDGELEKKLPTSPQEK